MNEAPVIGIMGLAGAGKDTVANIIRMTTGGIEFSNNIEDDILLRTGVSQFRIRKSPWRIGKFSLRLKQTAAAMVDEPLEVIESREWKDGVLPEEFWWMEVKGGTKIPYVKGRIQPGDIVRPTGRNLLEWLGTEFGRDTIHENIWVNLEMKKATSPTIFTDVRFENEYEAIRARPQHLLIRVERDVPTIKGNHPSRSNLNHLPVHVVIDNNRPLNTLPQQIAEKIAPWLVSVNGNLSVTPEEWQDNTLKIVM